MSTDFLTAPNRLSFIYWGIDCSSSHGIFVTHYSNSPIMNQLRREEVGNNSLSLMLLWPLMLCWSRPKHRHRTHREEETARHDVHQNVSYEETNSLPMQLCQPRPQHRPHQKRDEDEPPTCQSSSSTARGSRSYQPCRTSRPGKNWFLIPFLLVKLPEIPFI